MPNSFSKLYIHHVSGVKYRQALITPRITLDIMAKRDATRANRIEKIALLAHQNIRPPL